MHDDSDEGNVMSDQTAPEIRILPTLWEGSANSSTWGAINEHHPGFHAEDDDALEWHSLHNLHVTMRVVAQDGRNLELIFRTNDHESRAVGTLTPDSSIMVVARDTSSAQFTINGDNMIGLGTDQGLDAESGITRFASWVTELRAVL